MVSYRNIRAITEIYIVLCLLGSFEQIASLMCYFCAGTNSKSSCLDAGYFLEGFKDTDGKPQMLKNCTAPYDHSCIIEEYRAGGHITSHLRDCSDGLTFSYPAKEPIYTRLLLEAKTPRNRTACIFNSIVQVCLTACNTDFCNGPQYDTAGTYAPHIPSSPTRYDYSKALSLSILFYDAQRSGKLPAHQPISWRGDSALQDGDNGHDLTGGWYDAGDHVKFNLPMAMSAHTLLWGFIKFQDAYTQAGQKNAMCDMIKWPLDYFLKCWIPSQQTLYVQVGDGDEDHNYWGRPENMNMERPAFKVTASNPGSDVAGDTVSAFAAGSIVFKTICGNTAYADHLLQAAKSLYEFAKNHQGIYSKSVPQAAGFYNSQDFKDELAVAAAWMYQATHENKYINDAKQFHVPGTPWALSWDEKKITADLLLYEITKDASYKSEVINFVNSYKPGGGIQYTPCGLAFRNEWGPNRYAANAAFIAVMAAADEIETNAYLTWAMTQINYLLGDNKYGISYEIGFGSKYPQHPHHRGSSCPTTTTQCNMGDPGPNPNLLKGALVGGPDNQDNYDDRRSDYVKNEVACDYNAGFQGALAGLVHFAMHNALPAAPAPNCHN